MMRICNIVAPIVILLCALPAGNAPAQETAPPSPVTSPATEPPGSTWAPADGTSIQDAFWITGESHVSVLNDARDRSLLGDTFGYGVRSGYRWKQWSFFFQIEQNMWRAMELDHRVDQGALNIGLGSEISYLGGYVRSSICMGPSVLLFKTLLDDPGEVGLFLDFRPVGLRWPILSWLGIAVDPISFAIVAPVLDTIPLVMVEYRTTMGIEFYL